MDADLIGKFITKQLAVAMAKKTKQYEKNIKKLEKCGRDRVLVNPTTKTVQGAVDAPSRKRKHPRLKRPPSQDHLRNMRLDPHKSKRASSKAHREEDPNKQAMPTAIRQETGKRKNLCAPK